MQHSTVARWGNSLAIRLPKQIATQAGVRAGAQLSLTVRNNRIVLEKPTYSLNTLIAGITPENRHTETDTHAPTGREVW